LDVCILPSAQVLHIPNTKIGFEKLLKTINKHKDVFRVVLEHTGGYQKELVRFLHKHNLPVSVINPARARFFAKAGGRIAKTDAIDAENLAMFGLVQKPELTKPEGSSVEELRQLVHRRGQLLKLITSEKNRLEKQPCAELKKSLERILKALEKELDAISRKIQAKIESDEVMRRKNELIQSVRGVGKECSATLIATLPELGHIGRQQIAALVGLAPMNRDSGKKRGHAYIRSGRSYARCSLYMPALVAATQVNPVLKSFYNRLVGNGKPKKLALTACMRKLLVHLNSLLAQDILVKEM